MTQLKAEEIKISWSSRGRCLDNILVERLWRTVKYEDVFLRAYGDGWEAEISLASFFWRYGHVRPNSLPGGKTPYEVYNEIKPCSFRPGLKISGVLVCPIKAIHLKVLNYHRHKLGRFACHRIGEIVGCVSPPKMLAASRFCS